MSLWPISRLCREIEAERAPREAELREACRREHERNAAIWRSHKLAVGPTTDAGLRRAGVLLPRPGTRCRGVLDQLRSGPKSVAQIGRALGLTPNKASRAIHRLQKQCLVRLACSVPGLPHRYRYALSARAQTFYDQQPAAA